MVLKHIETSSENLLTKENILAKKENIFLKKENILAKKENIYEQNSGNDKQNMYYEKRCEKCKKEFSSSWYAQKHMEKCTGSVTIHKCIFCNRIFSFATSKYRHQQNCSLKNTRLITDNINIPAISSSFTNTPVEMHMHIHTNTNIQNIHHVQNVQNVQNIQNIQNVIIYNPDNVSFLTDHIDIPKLKYILSQPTQKHIVSTYSRELLDRVENQCIRKTNMRSSHSQVHIGNNQWKSLLDKELYPRLMCTIANGFCDFLASKQEDKHTKIRKHIFEKLIPFLDYLSDNGYCNDANKEKEVLDNFNTLVQELKLIAFDISKKSKSKQLQLSSSLAVSES